MGKCDELKRLAERIERETERLAEVFLEDAENRIIVSRIIQVIAERAKKARHILLRSA